jgi:hypothetical protein
MILTQIAIGSYLYLIATANEQMRGECNTPPSPPPHPLFFCGKLREYSTHSYWRQPRVARDEGPQWFSYPVTGAYKHQIFYCFLLLDNDPISRSHYSQFLIHVASKTI